MIGRILRQSEVTPEMANWAATLLGNPMGTEFHRIFGSTDITARVEVHTNGTATNPTPHPHPGITLYLTAGDPAVAQPVHALLPEGVDVSGHQGAVDWTEVAASGRSFAYIKASEGVTVTDGRMQRHFDGAGEAGLKRGAYHYFRARDGAEQVDHFLSTLDGHAWELPPVLDIEEADGQGLALVASRIAACVEAMPEEFLIYTMPGFWNGLPVKADELGGARLWVATWGPHPISCANMPAPSIWQYSASAAVPGYPGHADVNRVMDPVWWATLG
jgi:lysozyme